MKGSFELNGEVKKVPSIKSITIKIFFPIKISERKPLFPRQSIKNLLFVSN